MKFLIIALEYHPRDEVLAWANKIVAEHPEHRVIALTHAYLKPNKTRTTNRRESKVTTASRCGKSSSTNDMLWFSVVTSVEKGFLALRVFMEIRSIKSWLIIKR